MNSFKRFQTLKRSIEKISHISGFNPFSPTWKFERHRKLHLLFVFLGISSSLYSVHIAENGVDITKRSFFLGIFAQQLVKCFFTVWNASIYQQLIARIEILYRSKDKKTMEIMEKKIRIAEMIFKYINIVNSSVVIIFYVYPFVTIFLFEKLNLMLPFFLPFINPYDYPGFIVNSIFHVILLLYCLLLHNAFDISFSCFTFHATAIVDLIKLDVDDLSEFVEKCSVENDLEMEYAKEKLKCIINAQNDFDKYVEMLNDFYAWPCFAVSSTSIFSVCIALVLIAVVGWRVAYGLCWALFGQIFTAYFNGEIINCQYERLNEFFCEFPWYKLRVPEQKLIQIMIHKTQRPQNIMILFTGPLKMETFTIICNAIYSFFNVCETFLEVDS